MRKDAAAPPYRLRLTVLLFAAALLAAAAFSAPASAAKAASVQVAIASFYGAAGQTVSIPVTAAQPDAGIASYNMQIDYDPTSFEIVGVTPGYGSSDPSACSASGEGCFQSHFDNDAGWLRVIWADASGGEHPIADAGQLFVIQAKIKSGSAADAPSFSVRSGDGDRLTFTDSAGHTLAAEVSSGKLLGAPSGGKTAPPADSGDAVAVIVDGQPQEQTATLSQSDQNGKKIVTFTVDDDKVLDLIAGGQISQLTIPVTGSADAVVGELNGKLVKAMEDKEAVLDIQTPTAGYTLPASQIRIDDLSARFGQNVALQDIAIRVRIAQADESLADLARAEASKSGAALVENPVEFAIQAVYNGQTIDVAQFNGYVERTLALPEGSDPSRLTTGVLINPDGTLTHVPTVISQQDGIYYAQIRSLTNSAYSVIWNPISFPDLAGHWAQRDVNDLAARLIVQGVSATEFAPDRSVTRAEFAAILTRALGLHTEQPNAAAAAHFADVAAGQWFADPVRIAASYGLVGGYADGTFRPGAVISRQEAVVVLARAMKLAGLPTAAAGSPSQALAPFSDAGQVASWAADAASQAVLNGLIHGNEGKLKPQAPLTRAETAAMVRRLLVQAGLINE